MVTMKKQGEASVQSFSLTLASLIPDDNDLRPDQEAVTKVTRMLVSNKRKEWNGYPITAALWAVGILEKYILGDVLT